MSTKGVADVVFCIDSSNSMRPCIEGVRKHLVDFVSGLKSANQQTWDLRLDFIAHRAGAAQDSVIFQQQSMYNDEVIDALYRSSGQQKGRFFTSDTKELADRLQRLEVQGDEAPLVALDSCLDIPWRESAACHRVVILLSDEPFETGVAMDFQKAQLPKLLAKIQSLRVMLFIVAPESEVFSQLAAVDRSEYEVVDAQGDGLARVDFGQVLKYIGKSVSVSNPQAPRGAPLERGVYGQATWGRSDAAIVGD